MVLFLQELACFALFCQYIQYLWVLVGCGGWWVVGKFLYDWHLGGFGRFIAFLRYSFSCNISLMEFVSQKFKCTLYISSSCCYLFPIKVKDPYFCFVDNGSYYRNCLYFHFRFWHSYETLNWSLTTISERNEGCKNRNTLSKYTSKVRIRIEIRCFGFNPTPLKPADDLPLISFDFWPSSVSSVSSHSDFMWCITVILLGLWTSLFSNILGGCLCYEGLQLPG